MCFAEDHPSTSGVNHGEAVASHTEKMVNAHGTPAPHTAAHIEADRKSIGHAAKPTSHPKGDFFGK